MTPEAAVKANQKANYDAAHPAPGPRTKHEDCINNFYAFTAINPWMDGGSAGWNHTLSRAELACYEVKN